jgi:hypothetical protein
MLSTIYRIGIGNRPGRSGAGGQGRQGRPALEFGGGLWYHPKQNWVESRVSLYLCACGRSGDAGDNVRCPTVV